VALVALWGGPALAQTGGQFWSVGMGEHVFNRSVGVIDSHGLAGLVGFLASLPLYFVTVFASFFPWSLRLPGTIRRWWPERQRDELGWYLFIQVLLVFAVFSLVRTKLPHYTLPAFPCLALWLALRIGGEQNVSAWAGKRLVAMTVFILVLTLGLFTYAQNHLLTKNLWLATKAHIKPETKIGCFGYTEPSQVWFFRSVVTNKVTLGNVKLAASFLTNSPPFILVMPTKDLTNLPNTNGLMLRVRGLDLVKFNQRDLTAIVRE
ncbi:MAG TPA: hypothetical protein VL863_03700, partial [bacterium]|nr:hypothetical protein [bacterium]